MMNPFQRRHLFSILSLFEEQGLPLDVFLSNYFRKHRAVGANDRRVICEAVYGLIRWRGLLDHLASPPLSWEKRFGTWGTIRPEEYIGNQKIAPHLRVSFPKAYFQLFAEAYGEERALELCLASNTAAPTTVRVNPLKTTREALSEKWAKEYAVSLCRSSPLGVVFHKKINFFALPEFKEGCFEMQDEASQLVAALLEARPGEQILDYCAGSGGKTLAFAPSMQRSGQIYLHDVRPFALEEAKKRLRRAGVQNGQLLFHDDPKKGKLKGKMDAVLVDAPCSGSGTLRRNPDMKWKFDPSQLERLIAEQRQIFAEALEYLHPKGRIVYATCSILPQENQEQVAYFEKSFGLKQTKEPFCSFPQKGEMDGFFAVQLKFL